MNRIFYSIILLFLMAEAKAQSPVTQRLKERLQSKLDSLQKANGFPGVTFALILPGGEKITLASGLADSARQLSMKPTHRMLAGSIGKTFFAAPAMVLAEKGVFSLDDKIAKYIGGEAWFSRIPNASSVTMRMLLNHTSGIEEYYELGDFMQRLKNDPYKQWMPVETFSYIFDRKPLFAAGDSFGYADANYLILGYILEKITGSGMYDLAQQYALKPFNLHQTEPSLRVTYKDLATGYSNEQSPFPFSGALVRNDSLVFHPQFEWTGGGFVSAVSDLAAWAKELYHYRFISSATRAEMQKRVAANTGRGNFYGLGLQIRPVGEAGYSYGHGGWFPGYISDMHYFPQHDLAMAIQFNTDNFRLLKRRAEGYIALLLPIILEELK